MKWYNVVDTEYRWGITVKDILPYWIDDISMFHRQDFTNFFVTISYNRNKIRDKTLSHIHQKMDKKMLGSRYHLKDRYERSFFLYFTEYTKSNHIHNHILWNIPTKKTDIFTNVLETEVKKVYPSSSVDILSPYSIKGVVKYMSKDIWKNMEDWGMSSMFLYNTG